MDSFGERLRIKRTEKKLSQEKLAELMQKSGKTVISSWETGKAEPSLADLRKLAEILGTSPGWLLDGGEEDKSSNKNVPSGYTVIATDELIELQRQVIQQQKTIIANQK